MGLTKNVEKTCIFVGSLLIWHMSMVEVVGGHEAERLGPQFCRKNGTKIIVPHFSWEIFDTKCLSKAGSCS